MTTLTARPTKTYALGLVLRPDQALLCCEGELDLTAADDLNRLLTSLERLGCPIQVDLQAVTFLDSYGLHPFISATRRRQAGLPPLLLAARSATVDRLLTRLGLDGDPILNVGAWDNLVSVD